jgi:UDPglucose--hexose-1-phosphate uridylyltransferase
MKTASGQANHRRRNALTGEWVTVSPHRTERPWQGETSAPARDALPSYDASCYLCPGNVRVTGTVNADYRGVWVFDNDFPAISAQRSTATASDDLFFMREDISGVCRVICYSPRHDVTLATMSSREVLEVVDTWCEEVAALRQRYQWVQIFENKGQMMGCSSPHPHGQIWAVDYLPNEAVKEQAQQKHYFQHHGSNLLADYVQREIQSTERVVLAESEWIAVVPFWAIWPYETLVIPTRHVEHFDELTAGEREGLAVLLRSLLGAYDKLFDCAAPYTMGWHGAPTAGASPHWQLHGHIYPPLLRSASVRKHMVGYEMLSEAQRDLTPETAAKRLREAVMACRE